MTGIALAIFGEVVAGSQSCGWFGLYRYFSKHGFISMGII
ncbi:hypothetical protein AAULR_08326 [Lacticaseibacillus rhamnosus MTCC 5462]|nr:hypothetical protein AAULR_08326 [Lacticaseibacillus rhamnosus MTCC 5462]